MIAEQTADTWRLVGRLDTALACGGDGALFGISEPEMPQDLGCVVADDGSGVQWGKAVVPGAVGGRVTAVQTRLADLGYLAIGDVSGTYDENLRKAMLEWQRDIGIVVELSFGEAQLTELGLPILPRLTDSGVAVHHFGDAASSVEDDLATWLGPPTAKEPGARDHWIVCYAFTLCIHEAASSGDIARFIGYDVEQSDGVADIVDADPATWIWRTEPLATESGFGLGSSWADVAGPNSQLEVWCWNLDLELQIGNLSVLFEMPFEQFDQLGLGYGENLDFTPERGASVVVNRLTAGQPAFGLHDCPD